MSACDQNFFMFSDVSRFTYENMVSLVISDPLLPLLSCFFKLTPLLGHLKLTDFGLSCEIMKLPNLDHLQFSMVGTPDYVAPEVALLEGHSFAADWYQHSLIVFLMLCLSYEWSGLELTLLA